LTIEVAFPTNVLRNNRILKKSIRFVFSPMNELFTSLHVLRNTQKHGALISWELNAHEKIKNNMEKEFEFFGPLFDFSTPSFLLELLENSVISIDQEFKLLQNRLNSLSEEEFIKHVSTIQSKRLQEFQPSKSKKYEWDRYSSIGIERLSQKFLNDSREFGEQLVKFLKKYNELIFSEIWGKDHIKKVLINEITRQSINLEKRGFNATIIALKNDAIHWVGHQLMLYQPFKEHVKMNIGDKIFFMPSYFVWPHLFVDLIEEGIVVTYAVDTQRTKYFAPEKMTDILVAVGNTTRIEMLNFLKQAENTNQGLAQLLSLSESNISHHLSVLKEANLVYFRRVDRYVLYGVTPVVTDVIPSFFENLPDYYE
jgi:DNA-binding transcriptional ArsR family regulator